MVFRIMVGHCSQRSRTPPGTDKTCEVILVVMSFKKVDMTERRLSVAMIMHETIKEVAEITVYVYRYYYD